MEQAQVGDQLAAKNGVPGKAHPDPARLSAQGALHA